MEDITAVMQLLLKHGFHVQIVTGTGTQYILAERELESETDKKKE